MVGIGAGVVSTVVLDGSGTVSGTVVSGTVVSGVVGIGIVVTGGFHETVAETVFETPLTIAVAVYTAVPSELVRTAIVAIPEEFVVAVNVCPASGPELTVTVTVTPA